ncbi:MAG: allophanate hydrolase [Phycisphaerales bacterium]|nr:allophanate hydrolase [Phycisphaerales bacterium]
MTGTANATSSAPNIMPQGSAPMRLDLQTVRGCFAHCRTAAEHRTAAMDMLQRIKHAIHGAQRLNALIYIADDAWLQQVIERNITRLFQGCNLPLFCQPFVVKDNIDVAAMPTSAGCKPFIHTPSESAEVVERLCQAGALVIGKANLDQFATGLTGTRSPFGVCRNPFNPEYISGGSSSGSAVAVACGIAAFALGTDTAGSGRVPAALNNLVGLKPTRGRWSHRGVVPACRSLDCVSVFAHSCSDAAEITAVLDGAGAWPMRWSQPIPSITANVSPQTPRIGVPPAHQREFFGDEAMAAAYLAAIDRCKQLGATIVEIDFTSFRAAAKLLYEGPWVSERLLAAGELLTQQPEAFDPSVRSILHAARQVTTADVWRGIYQLDEIAATTMTQWRHMDMLLLPTVATVYRIDEILADPIKLNSNLGFYTNFVNLLNLCAVASPMGMRPNGIPSGVTFIAPTGQDVAALAWAAKFNRESPLAANILNEPREPHVLLAVVGAHLQGQPLHHQITDRGGTLVQRCTTSNRYRLYALANTQPPKPGLVRFEAAAAGAIEVEVYRLNHAALGEFLLGVPPPLAIGSIELQTGEWVKGFVVEPWAIMDALDITEYGGWRRYLAARSRAAPARS